MLFTGSYEHTIDAKNRLAIPSAIRSGLDPETDGTRFYVRQFDRLAERRTVDPIPDEDELTYDQITFSMASPPLEPDRQGRILLPEKPLRMAGIGKQVVIIGVRNHLELWNKSDYDRFLADNWGRYAEIQLRARQAIQQGSQDVGSKNTH